MRTRLMHLFPETAFERILEALERELIEATDADILEAANDLGMKPGMKGSAAFLGLRRLCAPPRSEDFFEAGRMLRMLNDPRRIWSASAALPGKSGPLRPESARTVAPRRKPPRNRRPVKSSRDDN